jgi:tetratricopeptide (TPR) repeat protein
MRLQLQILLSLNRLNELAEPLRTLLATTPAAERPAVIGALPRFLQRATDKRQAAALLEEVLQPYIGEASTRAAAQAAIGRAWLAAGDAERALTLARQTQAEDPTSSAAALLALELMPTRPEAEAIVTAYLKAPTAEADVRRAYAGTLVTLQRYPDAIAQLETVTRQQPDLAGPWLTLGALQLELRQTKAAEASLQRFVQLAQAQPPARATPAADDDDDDRTSDPSDQGLTQAWLLLAQAAEQRGDYAAAEAWLARIDNPQRALEVQTRRATLMARQGRVPQARELLRSTPERNPADARAKLLAEAQMLREVKQWPEAYAVLESANQRFPDDADLLYEQAMMAEKIGRLEAMETLLRRVMALKPDHAHAYNALGYSLADRNLRLPEAKALIERALQLTPGDPFITDSLGWVEFRLGNREEALRLLRQAYQARPDAEIGAHLGEVLWAMGQRDEARRVWAEVSGRDAGNDVLRETLVRLKAQ